MNVNKTILAAIMTVATLAQAQPPALKLATPAPVAQPAASPATIGQLSDMARQKRIAEETKPAAAAPVVPPGMTIVPSSAILGSDKGVPVSAKRVEKKPKPAPPPEIVPGLLAIAKTAGGMRYAEIADTSGATRYRAGQITSSGWVVQSIGAQFVELSRPAAGKKPARQLTLSISQN